MTPAQRHRHDLEAKIFGPDVHRHNGTVERGVGSAFASLPDHVRARIERADDLIAAERAERAAAEHLFNANAKHSQAALALARAQQRCGLTEGASNAA